MFDTPLSIRKEKDRETSTIQLGVSVQSLGAHMRMHGGGGAHGRHPHMSAPVHLLAPKAPRHRDLVRKFLRQWRLCTWFSESVPPHSLTLERARVGLEG